MILGFIGIAKAALVPGCDPALAPGVEGACGERAFFELVHNIIEFGFVLATLAITFSLVYGAFMYIISAGEKERIVKSWRILEAAVFGFIIALSAWVITNTIITVLVPQCAKWNIFDTGTICGVPTP